MIDLPKLSRRQFMAALLAGGVVTAEGLWMPGTKLISIPAQPIILAERMQRILLIGAGGSLPIGVNGEVMQIPYGEPVDIPLQHFIVLQNAKERRLGPNGWREVQAYPFNVLNPSAD